MLCNKKNYKILMESARGWKVASGHIGSIGVFSEFLSKIFFSIVSGRNLEVWLNSRTMGFAAKYQNRKQFYFLIFFLLHLFQNFFSTFFDLIELCCIPKTIGPQKLYQEGKKMNQWLSVDNKILNFFPHFSSHRKGIFFDF